MAADDPGTDPGPRETGGAASDPPEDGDDGSRETDTDAGGGDDGGSNRRSIPGLLARAAAWVVGPILLAVGAFGLNTATGTAGLYLLVGLLVTPRTRRELGELCRILCGAD